MKRERIDKEMSKEIVKRVLKPLALDLGAKRIRQNPYIRSYNHKNKNIEWLLGERKSASQHHGRFRTRVEFHAITYTDGKMTEGETKTFELDHRVGWSRRHDNRKVANKEVVEETIITFEETYNKVRSFSSLDVLTELTVTAQGEVAGFGGSVTEHTSIQAHTELEVEKFNHKKTEKKIVDNVTIEYPGPVRNDAGEIVTEGDVWLIERPVLTIQSITPVTQWGIWDCGTIILDLYDWSGNHSILPSGRHSNKLKFNGLSEVLDFMNRELVLQYRWSEKYRPSSKAKEGMAWLADEENRYVGPVEWDRVRVNENTGSLEPTIVTPD